MDFYSIESRRLGPRRRFGKLLYHPADVRLGHLLWKLRGIGLLIGHLYSAGADAFMAGYFGFCLPSGVVDLCNRFGTILVDG